MTLASDDLSRVDVPQYRERRHHSTRTAEAPNRCIAHGLLRDGGTGRSRRPNSVKPRSPVDGRHGTFNSFADPRSATPILSSQVEGHGVLREALTSAVIKRMGPGPQEAADGWGNTAGCLVDRHPPSQPDNHGPSYHPAEHG